APRTATATGSPLDSDAPSGGHLPEKGRVPKPPRGDLPAVVPHWPRSGRIDPDLGRLHGDPDLRSLGQLQLADRPRRDLGNQSRPSLHSNADPVAQQVEAGRAAGPDVARRAHRPAPPKGDT